jgi:beta-lactamase regulating signal transducer with metallopeptidase domain
VSFLAYGCEHSADIHRHFCVRGRFFDEALGMWVWLDRISLVLFDATVSTALFLSLVVLAILFCRQPARRLRIARVALLSSLTMIPLVALAPLPRLDIADAIIRSDLFPALLIFNPDQNKLTAPAKSPGDHAASWLIAAGFSAKLPRAERWLERSLALIDLAGVSIGLGWLILGCWGVGWLIRHSRQPSARTLAIFDRLYLDGLPARRRAALRVSARIQRPVVVGLLRPTILVPRSYEDLDDDGELLRLTLLHEIAHAEQSDPWFGTAASLAQTLWFFLPQVWWLRSQLLIDQEFLADRFAAMDYGTSSGYAASLLALAESRSTNTAVGSRVCGIEPVWPSGQDKTVRSPLFQRVSMLLHCPFRFEAHAPRSWSWTVRLAVIGASVAAACLCLRWPNANALEVWRKGRSSQAAQPFRVARLVAKPMVFKDGRSVAYTLPLVLQSHFELTVEILAYPADLAQVRIAGHPLGHCPPLPPNVPDREGHLTGVLESWHQVRLVRESDLLSLWVDGQRIPVDPHAEKTGERLTIEPGPARPVTLHNLVVTW